MKKSKSISKKSSSVIRPGTGSGHGMGGGKTHTPTSEPRDKHSLDGRKTASALK